MISKRTKPQLLLINPWIYDFTAYDFWSKPLGLLYLASILRKIGFQIDFIDCMDRYAPEVWKVKKIKKCFLSKKDKDGTGPFNKTNIPKPKILEHIPRNYNRYGIAEEIFQERLRKIARPNAILVTSIMTYWYPGVIRVIEIIKKHFPDCPIILGGIYATLCYWHALAYSGADFVIRNFKVNHLIELLNNINDIPINVVLGKNQIQELQHLDSCPYPAWDLYQHLDYICLITTKGCPFHCSYCASYIINSHLEFRKPEHIVEEIIYWKKKKGVNRFIFYDDALLVNAESHFVPLMKMIEKQNLNISFYTPNALHASMVTHSVAQLMIANGFKKIWLGFETSDCELQKKTGGKIDNPGFRRTIEILLKEGFSPEQIRAYVLIGLPGQSFNSVLDSINFVMETGIRPYLTKFSPIPGTKIWQQTLTEYGWQEPVDPLWHNDALMPYFSTLIRPHQYTQLKKLTNTIPA